MSEIEIFLSGLDKVADTLLEQVIIEAVNLLMLRIVRATLSNYGDIRIIWIDLLHNVIVIDIECIALATLSESNDVVGTSGISGSLSGFFG